MNNHINNLVNHWYPERHKVDWVLATVIRTEGSSYRKPGAMMLINALGQYFGLVSGGCLESDIMRKARQCLTTSENLLVTYDMREEHDLAWQLGIGCGGKVDILLQPISESNHWLELDKVYAWLNDRQGCRYSIHTASIEPMNSAIIIESLSINDKNPHQRVNQETENTIELTLIPSPHLAVFGGGVDARPLVNMAFEMGWHVTLYDHRAGYARESDFPKVEHIVNTPYEELRTEGWLQNVDAAVVMGHNVVFDAKALALLQLSNADYIGLLGPTHRTEKVLSEAKLSFDSLSKPLANPIGLNLGGDLPESIALSILSEIHAFMHQTMGESISHFLVDKGVRHS
jgi:xanthine/CO dehydrogenase XdhC/CoxF family maturation factor